jgi:RNA ligase
MKEFPSIRQFRDVVASVRRYCINNGKPLPVWTFTGRVKLHGTNSGIVVTPKGELRAQSRTRLIDASSDNAGFTAWVDQHRDELTKLLGGRVLADRNVTFFGEWCGGNIQDKVALNQCPKHFVLFGAHIDPGKAKSDDGSVQDPFVWPGFLTEVKNEAISFYNITSGPSYTITIDFSAPHLVQDQLEELVARVEAECPWAYTKFGVSGIGEGLVWAADWDPGNSDFWFKTKGDAHAKSARASKLKIVADPEKLANIQELVDRVLPQWRLDQGFTALKEQGVVINTTATGAYLQWVCRDVMKEETPVIEASGFEWKKDLNQHVIQRARQHFLKVLNDNAFTE